MHPSAHLPTALFMAGMTGMAATPAPTPPSLGTPQEAVLVWADLADPQGRHCKAETVKATVFYDPADKEKYKVFVRSVTGDAAPGLAKPEAGKEYSMDAREYETHRQAPRRLTAGILAVPFKYHPGDHSTTAGSTIGGYLGYPLWLPARFEDSVKIIASGGLALVSPSPAPADGTQQTSTGTLAGMTLATGLVGNLTGGTQFGVIVGWDFIDRKQQYKYDGKAWISFTIGYNFLSSN